MFDKFKNMYRLQKQAKQIKKELANIHIEAEVDGVIVIINGEQEVIDVKFPENQTLDMKKLAQSLIKAFNKAIKKSQTIAADKMKGVMGEMGMGGFPGM